MRRQRGFTLVELAVTIVVAGILIIPIGYVIYQVALADSRALDRVEAVHDTRVLAEELRVLARESHFTLRAGADAFEVADDGHTLIIYENDLPHPAMVTVEYDETEREIRITDHRDDPDTVRVVLRGVVDAEFSMPNRRSFELFVEVERGHAAHSQTIRTHAPNVRQMN